jgi:cardiolipin synthase
MPWRMPYANLRNHRKLLVVDGQVGFTGGMNLRKGNLVKEDPPDPITDVHFRITGPVVAHLQQSFVEDWLFATGEELGQVECFPEIQRAGDVLARGISDGPDDDFEKLHWIFMGAIAAARRSIRIVTPYFLPDSALLAALSGAALRGVRVDVVIPEKNNLTLVGWACQAQLWQVLEHGGRVWLTPPPFDHTKLFIVDDAWACVGSANWDPRSLRLNFEFNVELYGAELGQQVVRLVEEKIASAREVTPESLHFRPLPIRLRDGAARLLSPYL